MGTASMEAVNADLLHRAGELLQLLKNGGRTAAPAFSFLRSFSISVNVANIGRASRFV